MKLSKIKTAKLLLMAMVLLNIMSCNTDDGDPKTPVTVYYNMEELLKLHNGSEKSWRFTQIILPELIEDYKTEMKSACVSDDIYTFKPFNPGEVIQDVDITLGETLCFDEISDSESYEATLTYDPVIYNGEGSFEVRLRITDSRYDEAENFTRSSSVSYQLKELTEDSAVFALVGDYVEDLTYAWVFEAM